jgi:hypothetical protein
VFRLSYRVVGALTLLASLAVFPTQAHADQIDFLGTGRHSTVSIAGLRSGSFEAGELNWRWAGGAPDGFAESFYSYCMDVSQNLGDPQDVTVRSTEGFTNGVVDGGGKAAWLFNEFAAGIRSNTNAAAANTMAAALQVAIWEAMYDTSGNLTAGNFILNTTGAIRSQAQTYLNALYTAGTGSYNTGVATVLDVRRAGQDQIVARVAEPSTLLLMGVAFLVFAKRARRSDTPVS